MLKRETVYLLAILGIILTFFFCFRIVFRKFDESSKRAATGQSAALMPVVALSGGKISLFPYTELEDYIKSNPDHTFLIPEDQEENLRRQVQRQPEEKNIDASWTFKVEQRSPGKQLIRVSVTGNQLHESLYEATDKTITPQYAKHIGAGGAIYSV